MSQVFNELGESLYFLKRKNNQFLSGALQKKAAQDYGIYVSEWIKDISNFLGLREDWYDLVDEKYKNLG
jgi:hypothetical protein